MESNMKKMISVLSVLFVLFLSTSCQKDPDMSKLDDNFMVYTDYDKKENFSEFSTYYIPDSILLISDSKEAKYWKDDNALNIIDTYVKNMDERGYTRVEEKEDADLGIQVSYVEDSYYFTGYSNPYWWWDYPGYWYPGYWGGYWGGGWYYPYSVVYSYNVGSMLAELVNLSAPTGQKEKLPVLWSAYMTGLLSGSNRFNTQLAITAVNQAYVQSPYLKKYNYRQDENN